MAPVSLPRFPRLLWLVLLSCIREESPRRRLPAGRLAGMMSLSRALSVDDDELGIDVSPEVRAATAPDAELAGVELAPGTGHRLHGAGRRLPAGGGGDRGAGCRVGRPHPLPFAGRRGTDHRRLAPGRAGPAAVPHPLQSEPAGRPRRPRRRAGPGAGRAAHADGLPAPLRGRSVRQPARALVGRIYPTRADSSGVALFATDSAHVRRCRVWRRASLW